MQRSSRIIRALALSAAIATTAALAGCSSAGSASDKSGGGTTSTQTLHIAAASGITSLNPVLNGTGIPNEFFLDEAYEPLIVRKADGSFGPGLATKWEYTNSTNTDFAITLRSGVKFSDGAPLTAEGVKEWMDYFHTAPGGLFATQFDGISSIEVVNTHQLVLHLKSSDPLWPVRLTQNRYGYVISPKALKDPNALGTSTAGAGEYVLDKSATVTGSSYTYVPNKYYYDKAAIHFGKVVVTVVSDPNAALSALQSGQEDFAIGQGRSAAAAKGAGLGVKAVPYLWNALVFLDRDGVQAPALKDVNVRRALNFAVDRATIAKAVFGAYGKANDAMTISGFKSYSSAEQNTYTYDPQKAKQMLAAAGYPHGFTINAVVFNRNGTDETTFSQALQGELADVGVTLKLVDAGDGSTLTNDILAQKYQTFPFFGQVEDANQLVQEQLLPDSGVLNPFKVTDQKLLDLYDAVQQAPQSGLPAAEQALQDYIVDQALYLPVSVSDNVYFTSKSINQPAVSNAQPIPYIPDLTPAS